MTTPDPVHPLRERLAAVRTIASPAGLGFVLVEAALAVVAAWLRDEAAAARNAAALTQAEALEARADAIDPPNPPASEPERRAEWLAARYGGVHPTANVETVEGL